MNLKLRTKKFAAYAVATVLSLTPACNLFADGDDFGIWGSIEAKKKLTEKLDLNIEAELRSTDGVQQMDRRSLGVGMGYDLLKWLKADIGYVYIHSFNAEEKDLKDLIFEDGTTQLYNYNIDHSYWEKRDRLYIALTAEWKIGRIKFSLRERLQYQHTHDALTQEDKYRYVFDIDDPNATPVLDVSSDAELKEGKHETTLRSRLTAKWDIKKCKFTPFASVELFSRTDEWCGHDKLRYRIGTDYKIDNDNKISVYYLYQDNHSSSKPAGHAIGVGYSFDL